jgi:hypothetical protein
MKPRNLREQKECKQQKPVTESKGTSTFVFQPGNMDISIKTIHFSVES